MYPILPGVNAWNISNILNPRERAISIGYVVCLGNIGGLIGSFIYLDKEAPRYPTGFGCSFAFAAAGIAAMLTLEFCLWKANQRRRALSEVEVRQKYSEEELTQMAEKSPTFRYTL